MTVATQKYEPPYISNQNPLAPGVALDPFPLYKQLREMGPVVWLEPLGVWGVFRDAMVRQLITDQVLFTNVGGTGLQNYFRDTPWREPSPVLEVDPPDHTRIRSMLARVLSPGAINKLKSKFVVEAKTIVARLIEMREFDGVADFAKAFPVKVFLDAVGVADKDRDNVLVYNDLVRKSRTVRLSDWPPEDREAAEDIAGWLAGFCSRENVVPGSFGSQIYEAVDAGEISEHEGNLLVRTFISAGTETTIAAIAQTLFYLATNPDQWAIVRRDTSKVRAAFEETLRFDPPAQILGRCARDDFDWEGVRIGKHDKILGFASAANRDPARWLEPDRYLITRDGVGHLGLGTGIHGCVGQMLARLQADVLLTALASEVESIAIAGTPVRTPSAFRGFKSLPVSITPAT
jgi:cytochrome P450